MPAQACELSVARSTIERDERSPDMTTRLTAQREDWTAARDLELTTDGIETDEEEARPVTHAREGVAIAPLLVRDLHTLFARHLRPAGDCTMCNDAPRASAAEVGESRWPSRPALASDVPRSGSSDFKRLNLVTLCPKQCVGWPGTAYAASVRAVKRSFFVLALAGLTGGGIAAVVSACSSDSSSATTAGGDAASTTDAPRNDGGKTDAAFDAGPGTGTCEVTRAYTVDCSVGSDAGDPLTCGAAKFDAWCALNDQAINSDAYRRAEATCLTRVNCDGVARRDCEYRTYAMATPTTAQASLVAAYCQTCEPMDTAGCAKRKTTYDPSKGPSSTDDVFVAAWELNDTLADQIRTTCTGTALDGGVASQVDAGAANPCLKAFGNCAGDIYVNALPDCPK